MKLADYYYLSDNSKFFGLTILYQNRSYSTNALF